MRYLTSSAVALVSTLGLSPLATFAAESTGVLAVADRPGPSSELAELTSQLRAALSEKTHGVLSAAELRERMAGQTPSATLAELDRAYGGALATYQKGDFEGAVRTLRAIVQDLEKLPDSTDAFNQWTRAILRLARSEQTLGRGAEARELLERLVRAHPAVKVDLNQYPPSFLKQVDEVRAAVAALGKQRLTVNASAKNARVFVQGRDVGSTPLTIDLAPGKYRVSGTSGSLRVPTITIDLTSEGQSIVLNFALAETLRPAAGPGLALPESNRAKNLVAAGASLGLDRLLAAQIVTESKVEYLSAAMIDVRRGMVLREGRVRLGNKVAPAGALAALASFVVSGQSSTLVAATTVSPTPASRASLEARPGSQSHLDLGLGISSMSTGTARKLGWGAFGAAALGVGLGGFAIYEGLSASSSYDKASALLQPDGAVEIGSTVSQYKGYVADGDSAKTAAYVGAGGAAACAAVAGVLGYLSYRQTGEIGPFRF